MSNRWLFVGPSPISGIGQVMLKYSKMLNTKYITFGEQNNESYDFILAFILPVHHFIEYTFGIKKYARKKLFVMSICETTTVHPSYGEMFKVFPDVLTPSEFCRDVFKKQFGIESKIVPLYQDPVPWKLPNSEQYTFYTIGNIADPRKNIKTLIECFIRCNFGSSAKLLMKASCRDPYILKIPNIEIINGMLSDEELEEQVHSKSHCYINCSHSEGVGMGAVEAAIRSKPVIITDFGGLKEYVETPFTVNCTLVEIGNDAEFLFTPDMIWGQPNKEQLIEYMKYCFTNNITKQDHPETILKMNKAIRFFSHDVCNNT
jgi:glycosyltransferase involved in cell wall biosynthesis